MLGEEVHFLIAGNYSWKAGVGMKRKSKKNFRQHLSLARLHSLVVSGRAHQRRWGILKWKMLRMVAICCVTVNLLSLDRGGRELLCVPSLSPLPIPLLHPPLWNLYVLFMPRIFRIIPNLIAVSLVLPAAAVPKIKSRPTKGMLGWSLLIDQMLCCSKNTGHQVPSEAEKLHQTHRCWISNMIILIGHRNIFHLHIWTFSKSRLALMETKCERVYGCMPEFMHLESS